MQTRAPLPERAINPAVQRHLDEAARQRERAEALVRTIEDAVHDYAGLRAVPLDVVQRAAHALVALNAANLAHIGAVPEALLAEEVA